MTLDNCVLPFTMVMVLKTHNHLEDSLKHKLVCPTPRVSNLVGWDEAQELAFPTDSPSILNAFGMGQDLRTTAIHTSPNPISLFT